MAGGRNVLPADVSEERLEEVKKSAPGVLAAEIFRGGPAGRICCVAAHHRDMSIPLSYEKLNLLMVSGCPEGT